MGIGKLLKSIFSSSPDDASNGAEKSEQAVAASQEYNGFTIEAAPIKEGSQYRTAGFISGEVDGESHRVPFIRADNSTDKQAAIDHSLSKGRQIVDEQGKNLLSRTHL